MYSTLENFELTGYNDSDKGGIIDDRKSTSGYTFHFGTIFVSWASKKQPIVTLPSVEAEYVAATSAACQVVWMRRVLKDLSQNQQEPTKIFYDSNSSISLSKNHVFHKRTKHIDIRFYFIRELVNNKEFFLEFCRSEYLLAYIFTKPLERDTFQCLCSCLGMTSSTQ